MEVSARTNRESLFSQDEECRSDFSALLHDLFDLRRGIQLSIHDIAQVLVLFYNRKTFEESANEVVVLQKDDARFGTVQLHLVARAPTFDSLDDLFQLFFGEKYDSSIVSVSQHIFLVSATSPLLQKIINEDIEQEWTEKTSLRNSPIQLMGLFTYLDKGIVHAESDNLYRLLG